MFSGFNGTNGSVQMPQMDRTKTVSHVVSSNITIFKSGLTSLIFFNHSVQAPHGAMGFMSSFFLPSICLPTKIGLSGSLLAEYERSLFFRQASSPSLSARARLLFSIAGTTDDREDVPNLDPPIDADDDDDADDADDVDDDGDDGDVGDVGLPVDEDEVDFCCWGSSGTRLPTLTNCCEFLLGNAEKADPGVLLGEDGLC